MSYLKLLWVLSNGAPTSGMVLAINRSSSHKNSPFASPNIACLSVTHSGYWHPLFPAMLPRNHHLKHLIPQELPVQNFKEIQVISAKESGVIFLKKEREKRKKRKKRKAHSQFQVANYGVQINSNGKPSTSSLHTLQISHVPWDLNSAKYQPSCGSLFGWAIQVTKVCIYLPTHKLHISALEIGRTWSNISTVGEDHTLWATREYHWETWISFKKFL